MHKITIVIPVYNVEAYLRECVESVINQTYNNLEIILIDDGSKDNSGKICDDLKKMDSRIKVIHKENEGLGLTRNVGIEHATGDYIMFLDSDDYISADMIEILLEKVKINNLDVCKSGFNRIDDQKKSYAIRKYTSKIYDKKLIHDELIPSILGSSPEKSDSIEMCATGGLYNMKIIKNNNIRFVSERVYLSEDIFFNIDFMNNANKAMISDYVGYYYRYNPSSLSRRYRPDRFKAAKFLFEELEKKVLNLGYSENEILRISRCFFINLKVSISQERRSVSGFNNKTIKYNIKKMCEDEKVQEIINNYPINKLGVKQRIFLKLVKGKYANILLLLLNLHVF